MADERLIQRLEEQLRDAHATNADLRERIDGIKRELSRANVARLEADERAATVEKFSRRLKAAEEQAKASRRKARDAEREATKLRGENEELRDRLATALGELALLEEMDERVKQARHVRELIAPEGS